MASLAEAGKSVIEIETDAQRGSGDISPAQCRASRILLNWTQTRLAAEAGVSRSTITDYETGTRLLHVNHRRAIVAAIVRAGIEFLCDDGRQGAGIRLRRSEFELDGRAVRKDRNWAVVPVRYRGQDYRALVAIGELEHLAHRRFFSDEQIDESVSKYRTEVLEGAARAVLANPRDQMPVLVISAAAPGQRR